MSGIAFGKVLGIEFRIKITRDRYDRMIAALKEAPCTGEELDGKMFCSKSARIAMLERVSHMWPRPVRICKWLKTKGKHCPVYGLGSEPDAPMPVRRTPKQRHYDIKSNKQLSDERNAALREKKRLARSAKYPGILEVTEQYIKAMRKTTTRNLSEYLKLTLSTTAGTLRELEEGKRVMRISPAKERPVVWAIYDADWTPPDLKQVSRGKWAAPKIKPQSPWSALGL